MIGAGLVHVLDPAQDQFVGKILHAQIQLHMLGSSCALGQRNAQGHIIQPAGLPHGSGNLVSGEWQLTLPALANTKFPDKWGAHVDWMIWLHRPELSCGLGVEHPCPTHIV